MKPIWYCETDDRQSNIARLLEQLETWKAKSVKADPDLHTQIYPIVPCPYCGDPCECDMVDVGVGLTQCGPFHCLRCGAFECGTSEIGHEEGIEKTAVEKICCWYEPSKPPSPLANTVGGE